MMRRPPTSPHRRRAGRNAPAGRSRRGAAATEYMLILALVILPIALLFPMFLSMVRVYGGRMTSLMSLPFP